MRAKKKKKKIEREKREGFQHYHTPFEIVKLKREKKWCKTCGIWTIAQTSTSWVEIFFAAKITVLHLLIFHARLNLFCMWLATGSKHYLLHTFEWTCVQINGPFYRRGVFGIKIEQIWYQFAKALSLLPETSSSSLPPIPGEKKVYVCGWGLGGGGGGRGEKKKNNNNKIKK